MALFLAVFWNVFGGLEEFFVHMRTGKELLFAVFAPLQPEFGTFVCGMRVCMPGVKIVEIRGISGVSGYSGFYCLCDEYIAIRAPSGMKMR